MKSTTNVLFLNASEPLIFEKLISAPGLKHSFSTIEEFLNNKFQAGEYDVVYIHAIHPKFFAEIVSAIKNHVGPEVKVLGSILYRNPALDIFLDIVYWRSWEQFKQWFFERLNEKILVELN